VITAVLIDGHTDSLNYAHFWMHIFASIATHVLEKSLLYSSMTQCIGTQLHIQLRVKNYKVNTFMIHRPS